jgi:hypothetical protein
MGGGKGLFRVAFPFGFIIFVTENIIALRGIEWSREIWQPLSALIFCPGLTIFNEILDFPLLCVRFLKQSLPTVGYEKRNIQLAMGV